MELQNDSVQFSKHDLAEAGGEPQVALRGLMQVRRPCFSLDEELKVMRK